MYGNYIMPIYLKLELSVLYCLIFLYASFLYDLFLFFCSIGGQACTEYAPP